MTDMRTLGIILAGGSGSRLAPMTTAVSKQLLPIYDKPMIYYPMTTLIESGVTDVLIISQSDNIDIYRKLFGNGDDLGMDIYYAAQDEPRGLAEAILIAEGWCRSRVSTLPDRYDKVCLILGDNLFHGSNVPAVIQIGLEREDTSAIAEIFVYQVEQSHRYGVAEIPDSQTTWPCKVPRIIEKPSSPPSRWAVPGIYLYHAESALDYAAALTPSARGELEITDLNNAYAMKEALYAWGMGEGAAWLDSGTPESLLEAAEYVRAIQTRQGVLVGSPHLAAYRRRLINDTELVGVAGALTGTYYGMLLSQALPLAKSL
jgi:glucose-1-phosphate thymidylyltransferase